MATVASAMMTEELLALPDDGMERWLKVDAYLAAGVPLVWVVSPRRRTVTVHAPGNEPALFDVRQELSAEPHLLGFRVPVRRLFE